MNQTVFFLTCMRSREVGGGKNTVWVHLPRIPAIGRNLFEPIRSQYSRDVIRYEILEAAIKCASVASQSCERRQQSYIELFRACNKSTTAQNLDHSQLRPQQERAVQSAMGWWAWLHRVLLQTGLRGRIHQPRLQRYTRARLFARVSTDFKLHDDIHAYRNRLLRSNVWRHYAMQHSCARVKRCRCAQTYFSSPSHKNTAGSRDYIQPLFSKILYTYIITSQVWFYQMTIRRHWPLFR